ncbi:MAG: hypothetical protein QXT73_08780 [Candidatus Methanomethylicaceae archaeon]
MGIGLYAAVRDGWPAYEEWRWDLWANPVHLEKKLGEAEFEGGVIDTRLLRALRFSHTNLRQVILLVELKVRIERVISDTTGQLVVGKELPVRLRDILFYGERELQGSTPEAYVQKIWLGKMLKVRAILARWRELQNVWLFVPIWRSREGWWWPFKAMEG